MINESYYLLMKDYGKIHVKLKDLMDEHNITRYKLASSAHTRFEVIDKWYKDEVQKLDLDVLARICYVLKCSPSDILEYKEADATR